MSLRLFITGNTREPPTVSVFGAHYFGYTKTPLPEFARGKCEENKIFVVPSLKTHLALTNYCAVHFSDLVIGCVRGPRIISQKTSRSSVIKCIKMFTFNNNFRFLIVDRSRVRNEIRNLLFFISTCWIELYIRNSLTFHFSLSFFVRWIVVCANSLSYPIYSRDFSFPSR